MIVVLVYGSGGGRLQSSCRVDSVSSLPQGRGRPVEERKG